MQYLKVKQWEKSAEREADEKKYVALYFAREDNVEHAKAKGKGYVVVEPRVTVGKEPVLVLIGKEIGIVPGKTAAEIKASKKAKAQAKVPVKVAKKSGKKK